MNKNNNSNFDNLFESKNGLSQLFIFIGRSGRGKSHLVKYILTDRLSRNKWNFGLVFTQSKYNRDFDFLPDDKVIPYDEEVLKKYVNNLKRIKEKNGKVPESFIVMDDLQGMLNNQTNFMINFLSTYRHINVNLLICVQYLGSRNAISPQVREQVSHAIIFQSRTKRTLDNLYESFCGLFDSFEQFKQYFLNSTKEKYSAMLYSEHIDELEDNYKIIKAPKDFPKIKFDF